MKGAIENPVVKRTGQGISFIFSKMREILANELRRVKAFVLLSIDHDFRKRFVRSLLRILRPAQSPFGDGSQSAIENTVLQRTGHGISLIFSKMSEILANELHGVKSFVLWAIGSVFRKRFVRSLSPIWKLSAKVTR